MLSEKEFHAIYEAQAAEGHADSAGEMEYQRVHAEWVAMGRPQQAAAFIRWRANIGPHDLSLDGPPVEPRAFRLLHGIDIGDDDDLRPPDIDDGPLRRVSIELAGDGVDPPDGFEPQAVDRALQLAAHSARFSIVRPHVESVARVLFVFPSAWTPREWEDPDPTALVVRLTGSHAHFLAHSGNRPGDLEELGKLSGYVREWLLEVDQDNVREKAW